MGSTSFTSPWRLHPQAEPATPTQRSSARPDLPCRRAMRNSSSVSFEQVQFLPSGSAASFFRCSSHWPAPCSWPAWSPCKFPPRTNLWSTEDCAKTPEDAAPGLPPARYGFPPTQTRGPSCRQERAAPRGRSARSWITCFRRSKRSWSTWTRLNRKGNAIVEASAPPARRTVHPHSALQLRAASASV